MSSSFKTELTCARRVHSRDLNTINNTGFDFVLKSSAAPPYTIAISATETNFPCFVSLRCQKQKLFHSDNKNQFYCNRHRASSQARASFHGHWRIQTTRQYRKYCLLRHGFWNIKHLFFTMKTISVMILLGQARPGHNAV